MDNTDFAAGGNVQTHPALTRNAIAHLRDIYESARYGRVKAGKDGKTLLVALCDANEENIVAPSGKK